MTLNLLPNYIHVFTSFLLCYSFIHPFIQQIFIYTYNVPQTMPGPAPVHPYSPVGGKREREQEKEVGAAAPLLRHTELDHWVLSQPPGGGISSSGRQITQQGHRAGKQQPDM